MHRRRRRMIISILSAAVLVGLAGFLITRYYSSVVGSLREKIAEMDISLSHYQADTVTVLTFAGALPKGAVVSAEDVVRTECSAGTVPEDAVCTVTQAEGRILRIAVTAGTCVTEGMLLTEQNPDSERIMEYSCVRLGQNIGVNSCVDIRILFPDGSDYVVLSDKRIIALSEDCSVMTLYMNEEELLLMDSAMTDMTQYEGTVIYAAEYIESGLQQASTVNYTPSAALIELIAEDPNIDMVSSDYLDLQDRLELEARQEPSEGP